MAARKYKGSHAEVEIGDSLLGLTTDSIVVGGDEEVIEADIHSEPVTQRTVVRGAPFIEVASFVSDEDDILEESGVFDENGEWTPDREGADVTVSIYDRLDDEDPVVAYEGTECQPEWSDDLEADTDEFVTEGVTFHINGGLTKQTDFE